ncbi:SNF2 family N-terminal domain containing protein [Hyaloscypha variabilis]
MYKPFKPPLLKSAAKSASTAPIDLTESDDEPLHRPYKKRKLLIHVVEDSPPPTKAPPPSSAVLAPRKPLILVKNSIELRSTQDASAEAPEGYYMVLWRKFTAKKHKTWDGDGVLSVYGGYARLQDVSGREMGRCMHKDPLLPGSTLSVGGKDVEVDSVISKEDFLAGRPFLKTAAKRTPSTGSNSSPATKPAKTLISLPKSKMPLPGSKKEEASEMEIPAKSFYAHKSVAMNAGFRNPLLATTIMPQKKSGGPTPRHNPHAEGALVMKRPRDCPKGKEIVDVVLDPFLGQHLREHQRAGVKFMYECVMGMRDFNGQGAILADEMGLGKTLQTIALLWTLLKQNPIHGKDGVIKKALIVCPVTLISNWKKEFRKWLGNEKLGVFVADGQKIKLTDFTHGRSYSVMIIGYEKLRSVQDELKKGAGIDIVVADEGHRLKTAQNKSAQAIRSLNTSMRIILSGTPMQNDLSEFYEMVDFVNPGLLGTANTFKKEFEGPILKSRQKDASDKDIEKGNAKGEELANLTKTFILRRTAEILSKYLPPKTEYVLFCQPTQAQVQVYQHVLASPFFGKVLGLGGSEASLQLITLLKKVCNAPRLLMKKDENTPSNPNVAELLEAIPSEILQQAPVRSSGKFRVLDQMLKCLSETTNEKVVLVSNYTSTLDLLGQHLASLSLPFLRLDGSTPAAKRQDLVDTFNRTPASKNFAFLLSAKSGGAGINLIGASRLILFDVDWNPATDLQAMARIHRDGQKKPVKIYRFLMAGGMDEKIYQRQVTKMGLADSVVDGKKDEASFTAQELRDLFTLKENIACQTHELLGCDCKGLGADPLPPSSLPDPTEVDEASHDSDDDMLFPAIHEVVAATKANVDALNKRLAEEETARKAKNSKGKMQALMLYRHIDTNIFKGEMEDVFGYEHDEVTAVKKALDDGTLVKVLQDPNCKIGFVFAKRDRG